MMIPRLCLCTVALSLVLPCGADVTVDAQRATPPIQIVQATQIGKSMFEPGDTARGGNGQPVGGIEGSSREMLNVHIHAHLSLFFKGEQIAIPYGVGIVKPLRVENGFVGGGNGIYWLHTHDATGIIHVESPDTRKYTLGQFFDIWGQSLRTSEVAGLRGAVRAFVDGKSFSGNPRSIVLAPHAQITLEVGSPIVAAPVYLFPTGL
ncbi:MAG: hypothetical protein ABI051_10245 [Vicinamibacterales bacterium]